MVFSRLFFIYLFFPICFLCYFATKKTSYRNAVLIVFSLLFYACGDLSFLWLVVASASGEFLSWGVALNDSGTRRRQSCSWRWDWF